MPLLLPNRFKKIGLFLTPLGIILWISMQVGLIKRLCTKLIDEDLLTLFNSIAATAGFFAFLLGLYFLAFSKEKREDEMIHQLRVESFQFAALLQIIYFIIGFTLIRIIGEPDKEGMMLFFLASLVIFWIGFILRFNFTVHRAKYT